MLDSSGKVDFRKVREGIAFREGMERLKAGADKGYSIALMCSEAEPFDCHRFAMISPALDGAGFEARHILKDKSIISNAALEAMLLKKYAARIPQADIFNPTVTKADQLEAAYRLRNKDIGYSPSAKQAFAEEDEHHQQEEHD